MRVYYTKEMVASEDIERYSPSATKPKLVIEDWLKAGLDIEIKKPYPISKKDLYGIHNPSYVDMIFDGTGPNGFGDTNDDIINSLPFVIGAMIAATKYAFKNNKPAVALCSGFHHAGFSHGGGFCTFNGLIAAAIAVRKMGARKVGILDLDTHYGNGTEDIINKLKLDWISHFSAGQFFRSPLQSKTFLDSLPGIIKSKFWDCDVVICQLGADPYIDDPLGGWLTLNELKKRDQIVFETLARMATPVAWNLAGGYTRDKKGGISKVLEIHRNSAIACIKIHAEKMRKTG